MSIFCQCIFHLFDGQMVRVSLEDPAFSWVSNDQHYNPCCDVITEKRLFDHPGRDHFPGRVAGALAERGKVVLSQVDLPTT